jgi:hypothetical protein
MSTLTNGTTITLPDHLEWIDEFDFTPVAQRTGRTVTGALYVDEVALSAGRPITLQGAEDRWVLRAVLETLLAWAQTPNTPMTLNLRGIDYAVIYDRRGGKPIEARAVGWLGWHGDVAADDAYIVTVHFLVV